MAALVGLLLVSQVAAQPVVAADASIPVTTVLVQAEAEPASPRVPGGPNSGNTLSDLRRPDLRAELVSGWWVGKERHSQFRITNVGKATAKNATYWKQTWLWDPIDTDDDHFEADVPLGDIAPGASQDVFVVCKPKADWVCDFNKLDPNNQAIDDVLP
jgi:hypothetical protein